MRKGLTVLLISGLLLGGISFALSNLQGKPEQILTTDHESIITPPNDNAMRKGTHEIIRSDDNQFEVHGLLDTQSAIESQ